MSAPLGQAPSPTPAAPQAVGLRLPPGAAPALLRLSAVKLVDVTLPIADLALASHQAAVVGAQELLQDEQSDAMARALSDFLWQADEQDPVVQHATELLRENPTLTIGTVAGRAGISPRQLLRRFIDHIGYGPIGLARDADPEGSVEDGPVTTGACPTAMRPATD